MGAAAGGLRGTAAARGGGLEGEARVEPRGGARGGQAKRAAPDGASGGAVPRCRRTAAPVARFEAGAAPPPRELHRQAREAQLEAEQKEEEEEEEEEEEAAACLPAGARPAWLAVDRFCLATSMQQGERRTYKSRVLKHYPRRVLVRFVGDATGNTSELVLPPNCNCFVGSNALAPWVPPEEEEAAAAAAAEAEVEVEAEAVEEAEAEEAEERELVTEAEGFKLHLSSEGATGYLGVKLDRRSGRYQAHGKFQGSNCRLGTYDTAVQAAVAVARRRGPPVVERSPRRAAPVARFEAGPAPSCRELHREAREAAIRAALLGPAQSVVYEHYQEVPSLKGAFSIDVQLGSTAVGADLK